MDGHECATSIRELVPGSRFARLQLRVISEPRVRSAHRPYDRDHRVVSVEAVDDTGSVTVDLWDGEGDGVGPGTLLRLSDGYVRTYQGRRRVLVGKYGALEKLV